MSPRPIGVLGAALFLCATAVHAQEKAAPPAKAAPAAAAPAPAKAAPVAAAEDKSPNGCVDCHKGDSDLLTVLAPLKTAVPPAFAELAKKAAPEGMALKGKHPDVAAKKNIPQDCLTCHKADSKLAPSLNRLAHLSHLVGGEKFAKAGGSCASCHKLNADTGAVTLKMPPKK
jgi:cytochrome c2